MPIFSSSSHVQITGGNFIDVRGDFNLQGVQPPRNVDEALTGLEFGSGQDLGCQLAGAERTERGGGARMLPYGASEHLS
jgi:hypothetical protein